MKYFYGIVMILFSLYGCSEPQQSDFVGKWHCDGVELELKSDSTFTAIGDKAYLLLLDGGKPSLANKNLRGTWAFKERFLHNPGEGRKAIRINFKNEDTGQRQNNLLEYRKKFIKSRNSFPYIIYCVIGDPDSMDWLNFEKVQ